MTFILTEVESPQDIQGRNQLLQETLRPNTQDFSIEKEYPIALSPHKFHNCYSYAFKKDKKIISHANLWKRTITNHHNNKTIDIGLVGNVATDPKFQGQGIMKNLLQVVGEKAIDQGLSALILWSDLTKFYHKLGFKSWGEEKRYFIESPNRKKNKKTFYPLLSQNISHKLLESILKLRPRNLTLKRSTDEFRYLLTIPDTVLMIDDHQNIQSYFIIGKGADMIGVIHEWGGDPETIIEGVKFIQFKTDAKLTIVLCPTKIEPYSHQAFLKSSFKVETHPMAMTKIIHEDNADDLKNLFIWGLDSI